MSRDGQSPPEQPSPADGAGGEGQQDPPDDTEPARSRLRDGQGEREGRLKENLEQVEARLKENLDQVEARMPPRWQSRMRRMREAIRRRPLLDTAWRVGVFTLGVTLVAAGVVMFVIPGPGWATVILGLVVLASEFAWASRALDPVKAAAKRASDLALDPKRRRRNLTLAAIAGVAAAIVVIWYLMTYGPTVLPLLQLSGAVMAWVRGLFN